MKSFLLSIIFVFFHALNVCGQQSSCSSLVTRKEIRQLTDKERTDYITAVNLANAGPRPTPYDNFVMRHMSTAGLTHGSPMFFPFHRVLTAHFEQFLRTFVPGVNLPYWETTFDAADPASSPILKDNFCGGRGTGDTCKVVSGSFANRVCSYSSNPIFGVHYLRRCYNNGNKISPFYSYEVISNIILNAANYNTFQQGIQGSPHGAVHWGIGGTDMGDMVNMNSPCDPLFWPLHAYLDKLWDQWQRSNPSYLKAYQGSASAGIPSYSFKVSDTFDITRGPFCYKYSDTSSLHDQTVSQLVNLQKRDLSDLDPSHLETIQPRPKPLPLPDSYIARMHLNYTLVRENEQKYATFIDVCNTKLATLKKAVADSIKASEGEQSIDDVVNKYQNQLGSAVDIKKFAKNLGKKKMTKS
jgi:tyrosinase